MNLEERKRFITELCNNVRDELLKAADRMPDAWDGHELRQILTDRFTESSNMSDPMRNKRGRRRRDYENEKLVSNLP